MTAPGMVAAIHREYIEAGADALRTNTFRTREGDIGETYPELARLAVSLAREASQGRPVFGSLGPVGDCYDLRLGDLAKLQKGHEDLANILYDARIDEFVCETFPTAREAEVAVIACAKFAVPVTVSLTAGPSGDLMTPRELARGAELCAKRGASVVMVNCVGSSVVAPFVHELAQVGIPFGFYANAAVWNGPKKAPDAYVDDVRSLLALAPSRIGICCGGGPMHVRALRALLDLSAALPPPSSSRGGE